MLFGWFVGIFHSLYQGPGFGALTQALKSYCCIDCVHKFYFLNNKIFYITDQWLKNTCQTFPHSLKSLTLFVETNQETFHMYMQAQTEIHGDV